VCCLGAVNDVEVAGFLITLNSFTVTRTPWLGL
jgi:hypothetical protein